MKKYKVAIVGATGAVGREMLRCIFQFHFPFESLKLLASARSAGKVIEYEGHKFVVEEFICIFSHDIFSIVCTAGIYYNYFICNSGERR